MKNISKKFPKKFSIIDFGSILFLCGIFFLPSTLLIGGLFLLPAAILGSLSHRTSYLRDKWNYPFLIFGILIVISSILQNSILNNNYQDIWDPMLSIVGMGNWIPFIWMFWAFQPFLDTTSKRRIFAFTLISGSFPILMTGFGQYFLNWTGPFETLNGLIIWYQRPIVNPGGLSGLFNNQNYAGSWLNLIWPFCIALFIERRNNFFKKTIAFSFLISTGLAAFLTFSRNAWLGLITSLPMVIGKKGVLIVISFITIILLILFFAFSPFLSGEMQNSLRSFLPEKIILEFSEKGYQGLDSTRQEILLAAINLIKSSPIFGIGAASFSKIYLLETNYWKGHSHNLLIELALSYGLPATILFFITISFLLCLSGYQIFVNKKISDISLFDRAFWAALFFFLISQLVDIQYFDGKISIIAWLLIAGLKNIINENINKDLEAK